MKGLIQNSSDKSSIRLTLDPLLQSASQLNIINQKQGRKKRSLKKESTGSDLQKKQNLDIYTPKSLLQEDTSMVFGQSQNGTQENLESSQQVIVNLSEIQSFKLKKTISSENSIDESHSMIIRALQQKPKERRASNLNELIKITETLPFFQRYIYEGQKDIVVKCCQQMEIEFYEKNNIVFEIGSIGEKFYLILEGEVDVFAKIPNNNQAVQQQPPNQQQGGSQTTKNSYQNKEQPQDREITDWQQNSVPQPSKVTIAVNSTESPFHAGRNEKTSKSKFAKMELNDMKVSSKMDQYDSSPIKTSAQTGGESSVTSKQRNIPSNLNNQAEMLISALTKQSDSGNKNQEQIKEITSPMQSISSVENPIQLMLVKKLKEGSSFGELALIYNKPRLATIKCTKKCIFAVLQKNQYTQILKAAEEKNLAKQIQKLSEIPLFRHFSFDFLKDIFLNSESTTYRKNDIIFAKGDQSKAVYVVQSGEFSIRKKYDCPQQQGMEKDPLLQKLDSMSKEGIETLLKTHNSSKQRTFTLLNMCTNEIFGEEDLLKEQNRSFEVFCSSFSGQLLVIKDIDFRLRIFERNKFIQEHILQRLETKEIMLKQKEDNLMEQFGKYKNYLVENRQELKNIIFSQILMDQSCSVPVQSPTNQSQLGSQFPKNHSYMSQSNSPSKFRGIKSTESSRSKDYNMKLQNTFGTQHSVISVDQVSPQSMKNEFVQNTMSNFSHYDSKQLTDHNYYQFDSPKKNNIGRQQMPSFRIQSQQRSHSDSSRNYKSSMNQKTTFEFLDNYEDQTTTIEPILEEAQDNKTLIPQIIQQVQQQDSRHEQHDKSKYNKQKSLNSPQSPRQNIYNDEFFEEKEGNNTSRNTANKQIEDNQQDIKEKIVMMRASNQTPNSTPSNGFFQIEVSKRKRIMLATKYEYQNYLSNKDDENRFLLPMKKLMTKTLKEKKPLLIEIAHQKQQEELFNSSAKASQRDNKSVQEKTMRQNTPKIKIKTHRKQLSIATNVEDKSYNDLQSTSTKTPKTKSFYQYQVESSLSNSNQQTYAVQLQDLENSVTNNNQKQTSFRINQIRQSCKSADSKRIVNRNDIQESEDSFQTNSIQKKVHEQKIQNKKDFLRPKSPKMFNQKISLQITPFVDDIYLDNDKTNQTYSSKQQAAASFYDPDLQSKQITQKSPRLNLSPKKVIEQYKQYLVSKQQPIQKSNKLGAFTAYNKTKDTTFYIQKNMEKRMIQTMTDWRRNSQGNANTAAQNTEYIPFHLHKPQNNTVPIKFRTTSLSQTPEAYNVRLSLQPDSFSKQNQESSVQTYAFKSHRGSLYNYNNNNQ